MGNRIKDEHEKTIGFKDEVFDFNENQPGHGPSNALKAVGQAHDFGIKYETRQPVEAKLKYRPDGSLELKDVIWGEME